MADFEEGYISSGLRINPKRKKRFLKHVANNIIKLKKAKSQVYRKRFLDKIDRLRNIEKVHEIKTVESVEPKRSNPLKELENKVNRVLELEKQISSNLGLGKLSENKSRAVEEIKQDIRKLRASIQGMKQKETGRKAQKKTVKKPNKKKSRKRKK